MTRPALDPYTELMIQLWLLSVLVGLTPTTSQGSLSVSNGYAAAVIEVDTGALTGLLPHPYAERSPGEQTPDLAYDLYGGLSIVVEHTRIRAPAHGPPHRSPHILAHGQLISP